MQTRTVAFNLSGKVALVTGAGSGIGRAAALAFAAHGAAVVLAGRRRAALEAVRDEILAADGRAIVVPTDVQQEGEVAALVKAAVDGFGRLDVAFNNAGVSSYGPVTSLTAADFDNVIATNLKGVWLLVKHEIQAMRALGQGGAIVNTSSIAATGGTAGLSLYAASKGALDAMVRALAVEVGGEGIRINNVSPGLTATPMTESMPQAMLDAVAAHTPLKRIGAPEDVADVAVWLAGEGARFVTGQSILADGGFNIPGQR
ncbi:NAD(P)-dependent dehydrogenase (short-subunit alcohol dehydrogenase family) [Duganella sp. 1224]|uniref:SDR family NAD(P)-dependent oxidoreductase n=1 Tax=Duganella sp. 1224 TaxID=2587052 RepID=UPI0015C81A66|nr:SDR family NAD(P)-dependent oxidoreductase [Duganella sp. 1224]NYE62762.1 NAD(P)-dependent dehydrogenase (short-subunit alcohol dehydrogenase family) [Duganella sp. 1224]